MDKETLKKVVLLVSGPDLMALCSALKEALLVSHQLTDFQRVEMLLAMGLMGGRKPLELLVDLLEICLPGQQQNIFCWPFPSEDATGDLCAAGPRGPYRPAGLEWFSLETGFCEFFLPKPLNKA